MSSFLVSCLVFRDLIVELKLNISESVLVEPIIEQVKTESVPAVPERVVVKAISELVKVLLRKRGSSSVMKCPIATFNATRILFRTAFGAVLGTQALVTNLFCLINKKRSCNGAVLNLG